MYEHLLYSRVSNADRSTEIVKRFGGERCTLHTVVPSGLEKYVRICPPGWHWKGFEAGPEALRAFNDVNSRKELASPLSWQDATRATGRTPHKLMSWYAIAPESIDPRSGREGVTPPDDGQINLSILETLFGVFMRRSDLEQDCLCAFWEGFGGRTDRLEGLTAKVEGIGQQGHFLLSATLGSVKDQWELVLRHVWDPCGLTPNAVWPATVDWYYAVPFEMTSSYFGGPAGMADEILVADGLEAFEVSPGDDIWHDRVNKNP